MSKSIALLVVLALASIANAQRFPMNALAVVGGGQMSSNQKDPIMIFGEVSFFQAASNSPVVVNVNITFFPPNDPILSRQHGFHVHTFGISSNQNDPAQTCESAGPHWNPMNMLHGDVNEPSSHAGDLGNVDMSPMDGRIVTRIVSQKLTLFGANSILGRSVVLHQTADDLGRGNAPTSAKAGNAGSKIACGTIGLRP